MAEYLSPAKLNLFFQIINKRDDGYHEIASLFQAINLFDLININLSTKDRFESNDKDLPFDDNNLIIKALVLFREKTQLDFNVDISLEKNIPMQAGLGGGSSNAATTLWALNELLDYPLSTKDLKELAIKIGSDVPFFLSNGTAFCIGRGEIIEEFDKELSFSFFIAKPTFGLSTVKVYKNVNLLSLVKRDSRKAMEDILENQKANFYNDLELSAFEINPELKKIKKQLKDLGFSSVVMTGSGSSFFCMGNIKKPILEGVKFYSTQTIQRNSKKWYSF